MSVPDSVGKCPPLSEEVEARAVEAACAGFIPEWGRLPNSEAQDWRSDLSHALAAAAPIIAEAGYRAAQVEFSARVEALAMEVSGRTYSSAHMFQAIERIVNEIRGLAALTDSEGRHE